MLSGHNSTISFAQIVSGGTPSVQTLRVEGLPYASVAFLSDNSLVATGWDNRPHIYTAAGAAHEPSWYVFHFIILFSCFSNLFVLCSNLYVFYFFILEIDFFFPDRSLTEKLDTKKKGADSKASAANAGFAGARAMFQASSSQGIGIKDGASTGITVSVDTRHQNTITGVCLLPGADGKVSKFSTCGADGRVLMWDLTKLDVNLAALKLA
jgi:WD40 repeat protein